MQVIEKNLKDIIPYANNPRKNDKAVKYVTESIKQFGFRVPIVIDRDNVIVCGHTRYKAAQALGMTIVPCVTTEDLTPEQVQAFRLADNKVAEFADWDYSLLNFELEQIEGFGDGSLEMQDFGFELPTGTGRLDDGEEEDDGYYGDERERTFNSVNLHDYDETRAAGFYNMPILKATDYVPADMIAYKYAMSQDEFEKCVHFYIDDYQFERLWNRPHQYIDRLSMFDGCLTPDFSLYMDMPVAMMVWNVYRSRLIGQIMQDAGIKVIPTLQWAGKNSYKFCFDGIEKGGTVSVSTVGVMKDEDAMKIWRAGMAEAIKRIEPKTIVLYGAEIDYDFPQDINIVYIKANTWLSSAGIVDGK